jgi:HTH-type transcriptional regulator/antitoxin HigA
MPIDEHLELVRVFPLRPLQTDVQLDGAVQRIDELLRRPQLTPAEEDYLAVLSDLVKQFESNAHPMMPVSDADLLRHLIEAKGVSHSELAAQTGIDSSLLDQVLEDARRLTRSEIARLSRYFHIRPDTFSFEE